LFKEYFQRDIKLAKKLQINTYNATEGGARIEGSIEKPFKEVCEELLINDDKNFTFDKQSTLYNKNITINKINSDIRLLEKYIENIHSLSKEIYNISNLKLKDLMIQKDNIIDLINKLDFFKNKAFEDIFSKSELLEPLFFELETQLLLIFIQPIYSEQEKILKNIEWLNTIQQWFEKSLPFLHNQKEILEKNKNW
ncbi:hypothetical protein CAMP5060_07320, partial [Campylobacter sp. 1569]|nr:hypothetical protein [Campylobacter sp. 1569]